MQTHTPMSHQPQSLFDWSIISPAIGESFKKLNPGLMIKNPVMFVTEVGALLTTVVIFTTKTDHGFIIQLAVWLWFTVLTLTEFALLTLLARYAGKIVTQKQIMREVWPGSNTDASLALRVHVNHLRSKLGGAVSVKNEPGIGYRLEVGLQPGL